MDGTNIPKRYSFIAAHPDDTEFFCGMFIRSAIKKGHDVEVVSMTKGEWGTLNRSLKGDKLAQIRSKELQDAAKMHGVPKNKVKFLGLLDGRVNMKEAIIVLREYIQKRKPDVIFAPEYTFSVYVHSDHIVTGRATCLLLKHEFTDPRPKFRVYHSFKNNLYIRCDLRATGKALGVHQTQVQVIGMLYPLRWIFNILNGFFYYRRILFMEGARRVFFNKKIRVTLLDRLLYALYSIGKLIFRAWTPEDAQDKK